MKIVIANIPEEGQIIAFQPAPPWLVSILESMLPKPQLPSLTGEFSIERFDEIMQCKGNLSIDTIPTCDRCLEEYRLNFCLPIKRDFSPLYTSDRDRERHEGHKDELELTKEDIEFSFYNGPELDISAILQEEISLGLPIQYFCSPTCKGLCPRCGQNLNLSPCACPPEKPADPRWEPLKRLSLKRD